MNLGDEMRRLLAAVALASILTSCATTFENGERERIFRGPGYTIAMTRSGCNIDSRTIRSLGPALPVSQHGLMLTAKGVTTFTGLALSQPTVPGGMASSSLTPLTQEPAAATAGIAAAVGTIT